MSQTHQPNDISLKRLRQFFISYLIPALILLGLVMVETLSHTHWLRNYNKSWISIIYMLAGLGIGVIPLFWRPMLPTSNSGWMSGMVTRILWIVGLIYAGYFLHLKSPWIFGEFPVDIRIADMLPVMRVMGRRFLNGSEVYADIPEFWGGTFPIYLPAFWMPYLPSLVYGFEMRWISEVFMVAGCAFAFRVLDTRFRHRPLTLLALIPLLIIIHFVMNTDFRLVAISQEGIVIGYYLFLAYALTTRNAYLQGLAIALCLLSRYSFLFWVPMYLIYVFVFHSRREGILIAGISLLIWMALMFYTGAIYHVDFFLKMPRIYLESVLDPGNSWKYGPIFQDSLGMARFFGIEHITIMHKALFVLSLLAPFSLLFIQYFQKHPIPRTLFALCSLKLTLVIFYNLLLIPALYLFYTNTFFSLGVLFYCLSYND